MNRLKLDRILLDDRNFVPTLLNGQYWDFEADRPLGKAGHERYCWNYEMQYVTSGRGEVLIDRNQYQVKKGDVLFIKPGQYIYPVNPFSCYILGFDLVQDPVRLELETSLGPERLYCPDYDHKLVNTMPSFVPPPKPEEYRHLFYEILRIDQCSSGLRSIRIRILLFSLLLLYHDEALKASLRYYSPNGKMVLDMMAYIDLNLDENLTLEHLSRIAGISRSHFLKVFKDHQKVSPRQYIEVKRIEHAKNLLVESELSIMDIAIECGYESATYFATVFYKKINLTPTQYRRMYKPRID